VTAQFQPETAGQTLVENDAHGLGDGSGEFCAGLFKKLNNLSATDAGKILQKLVD
jgi:hypothetical protein